MKLDRLRSILNHPIGFLLLIVLLWLWLFWDDVQAWFGT